MLHLTAISETAATDIYRRAIERLVQQAELGRIAPLHRAGEAALSEAFIVLGRPGYVRPALVCP